MLWIFAFKAVAHKNIFEKKTVLIEENNTSNQSDFDDDIVEDAKRRDFKLNAIYYDFDNYIIYVFENLDCKDHELKYFMCTRFPNWEQSEFQIGDRGYVNIKYVKEGVSQWYDGEKMNVYKYTNVVFLKFVKEPEKVNVNFIVD